jgi:hypothetical protein
MPGKKPSEPDKDASNVMADSITPTTTDSDDSLPQNSIDTTNLTGKRQYILQQFQTENPISLPGYDTLLDLNNDGVEDYIIGYYGQSGTGLKNRVSVYLYDGENDGYHFNEKLSGLPNPSFYMKQKKITWFYIANGGGDAGILEWINGTWTTTIEFDIDRQGVQAIWEITYPPKHKGEKIVRPFQPIPPDEILENSYNDKGNGE